jgi:hypothetical protein
MIPLRKSTASQEVLLGPFLDDTDGKTAETGLTIANTDIKLWKRGGTTESNKNSGGATHIADGRYYATLDATDTDTTGELILNVAVAGALPVRLVCCVFEAAVFDALFASGAAGYSTLTAQQVWEYSGARTLSAFSFTVAANVTQWNGGALPTFPTHFGSLLINSSGHLSRVTLVDTTTTNSDMRGTDGAALATVWTSTVASRIDMPLSDIPTAGENADAVWDEVMSGHTTAGTYGGRLPRSDSSNVQVQLTGSKHIACDVHELQPAVIEAQHFALGAIDANAVAADASSEIATAVRAELAVELARIDVTVGSRLATIAYTSPPSATTIADTVLSRALTTAEATAGTISLCTLVLALTGKASVTGGVLTVYRTNGSTVHATIPVASDANAEPIVGIG